MHQRCQKRQDWYHLRTKVPTLYVSKWQENDTRCSGCLCTSCESSDIICHKDTTVTCVSCFSVRAFPASCKEQVTSEFWGFRKVLSEASILLWNGGASVGIRVPTFQGNVLSPCSRVEKSSRTFQKLEKRIIFFLEMSGSHFPFMERHVREESNAQQYTCLWECPVAQPISTFHTLGCHMY
jgi:hypothetical protein